MEKAREVMERKRIVAVEWGADKRRDTVGNLEAVGNYDDSTIRQVDSPGGNHFSRETESLIENSN
jgi:hypothetical protein